MSFLKPKCTARMYTITIWVWREGSQPIDCSCVWSVRFGVLQFEAGQDNFYRSETLPFVNTRRQGDPRSCKET